MPVMTSKISRPSTLYDPSQLPSEVMEPEFLVPSSLQPVEVNLPTDNIADLLLQCRQVVTELNAKIDVVAEVLRLRDEVYRLQSELNAATSTKTQQSQIGAPK